MKTKTCPQCNQTSHSAGAVPWICPHCGADITEVPEDE